MIFDMVFLCVYLAKYRVVKDNVNLNTVQDSHGSYCCSAAHSRTDLGAWTVCSK